MWSTLCTCHCSGILTQKVAPDSFLMTGKGPSHLALSSLDGASVDRLVPSNHTMSPMSISYQGPCFLSAWVFVPSVPHPRSTDTGLVPCRLPAGVLGVLVPRWGLLSLYTLGDSCSWQRMGSCQWMGGSDCCMQTLLYGGSLPSCLACMHSTFIGRSEATCCCSPPVLVPLGGKLWKTVDHCPGLGVGPHV